MKLITESNFEINTSTDDDKRLYIEGIFATAEAKNKNGRVYPKALLEREITSITDKVASNSCVGELNHPTDRSEIDLNEAALKITSLNWEGNNVMGKAMVLSTPKGQLIKNLIDDKVRIGISSRGLGTVSEGKVNDDFQLLTWDVVQNPSNHGSFVNGILEGKEFNTELEDKTLNEALKKELTRIKEELEALKTKLKTITEEVDYTNKIKLLESL